MNDGNKKKSEGQQSDFLKKKLVEHDKEFDKIDKKLVEHDKRFDEHDKRFDEVDRRFDEIDKKIEAHTETLAIHTIRLNRIEEKMVTKDEFRELSGKIDYLVAKAER